MRLRSSMVAWVASSATRARNRSTSLRLARTTSPANQLAATAMAWATNTSGAPEPANCVAPITAPPVAAAAHFERRGPAANARVLSATAGPKSTVTSLSTPQLGPARVTIEPAVAATVIANAMEGARRRHSKGAAMATPQNAHHVCPSWRYGSNAGIKKAASTIAASRLSMT